MNETKKTTLIPIQTTTMAYYTYTNAEFEVLLPCIFGIFVVMSLSK